MEGMIRVTIMHPTTSYYVDVEVPNDMEVRDMLDELADSGFMQ